MQLVMETQIEVPGGSGADSSAEDACNGSVHGASPNAASASAASPMPTPLPTSQRATTEQQPAPAAVPPVPSVLVNNQPIAQTLSQDAASAAAGPSAVPPAGSHRSVPTSPTLGPAQATDSGACASAPDTPAVRQSTALNPGSASTDSHQPSAPPLPAHGGTVSPQPSAPLYYPWPTPENPIPSSPSLVDWASLPPPPLYTSNADFPSPYAQSQQQQQQPLPVSDIPSYRYTDISYTTHAPPGYQSLSSAQVYSGVNATTPAAAAAQEATLRQSEQQQQARASTSTRRQSRASGPQTYGERRAQQIKEQERKEQAGRLCLVLALIVLGFFTFGLTWLFLWVPFVL